MPDEVSSVCRVLRRAGELAVALRLGSSVTSASAEAESVRRKSSDAPGSTGRRVMPTPPRWRSSAA
jgi:hypothetical protein